MSEQLTRGWLGDAIELRLPTSSARARQPKPAERGAAAEPLVVLTPYVRLGALGLGLVLAAARGTGLTTAPWIAALLVPELLVRRGRRVPSAYWLLSAWWAIVASAGVLYTGGVASPL